MLKDIIEERQNDFERLAYGVKSRIEGQMTTKEPGVIKALQILIDSHAETAQIVAREVVKEERERIYKFLYEKSHAGFTAEGEEYERYVHWCYVKEAILQSLEEELMEVKSAVRAVDEIVEKFNIEVK